jgi:hypothetical protein
MQMLGFQRGGGGTPQGKSKMEESSSSGVIQVGATATTTTITTGRSNAMSPGADKKARALRLVYCDERGVFRMDAEAVAALQLVKGPLGVVSVCGRARQGKSFILNQVGVFCFEPQVEDV